MIPIVSVSHHGGKINSFHTALQMKSVFKKYIFNVRTVFPRWKWWIHENSSSLFLYIKVTQSPSDSSWWYNFQPLSSDTFYTDKSFKIPKLVQTWCHTWEPKQVDLCKFLARLVCTRRSRLARLTKWDPISKKKKNQTKKKDIKIVPIVERLKQMHTKILYP